MAEQAPPKKLGRPATGRDVSKSVSLDPDLADAIDAAARAMGVTGAGKIRQLVVSGFAAITGQRFRVKIDKQHRRAAGRAKQLRAALRPTIQPAPFDGLEPKVKRRGRKLTGATAVVIAVSLPKEIMDAIGSWAKSEGKQLRPALRECILRGWDVLR